MSTKDYGEPWKESWGDIANRHDDTIVRQSTTEECDRIVACVNACAGIDNPESALAAAREALHTGLRACLCLQPVAVMDSEIAEMNNALTLLAPQRKDTT